MMKTLLLFAALLCATLLPARQVLTYTFTQTLSFAGVKIGYGDTKRDAVKAIVERLYDIKIGDGDTANVRTYRADSRNLLPDLLHRGEITHMWEIPVEFKDKAFSMAGHMAPCSPKDGTVSLPDNCEQRDYLFRLLTDALTSEAYADNFLSVAGLRPNAFPRALTTIYETMTMTRANPYQTLLVDDFMPFDKITLRTPSEDQPSFQDLVSQKETGDGITIYNNQSDNTTIHADLINNGIMQSLTLSLLGSNTFGGKYVDPASAEENSIRGFFDPYLKTFTGFSVTANLGDYEVAFRKDDTNAPRLRSFVLSDARLTIEVRLAPNQGHAEARPDPLAYHAADDNGLFEMNLLPAEGGQSLRLFKHLTNTTALIEDAILHGSDGYYVGKAADGATLTAKRDDEEETYTITWEPANRRAPVVLTIDTDDLLPSANAPGNNP